MSLLPGRILPYNQPLGRMNEDGTVIIDKNWWLFFYNLSSQVLGSSGNGLPAVPIEFSELNADIGDADAVALRVAVNNALLFANDALLPDPQKPAYLLAGPFNTTNTNNTTLVGSNADIQVGATNGIANKVIFIAAAATGAFATSIGYSLQESFTVGQIVQLVNVGTNSIETGSTVSAVDPYRIEMPDSTLDLSGGTYQIRPSEVVTLEYMSSTSMFPTPPHLGWVVTSSGIPNSAILLGIYSGSPITLTIPPNAKAFTIYFGGGGGGGGGGVLSAASGGGGGGGGGGGISSVTFVQGNLPASLTVYAGNIGAGGNAGAATGVAGTNGGSSYVQWTDSSANTYQLNASGGSGGSGATGVNGGAGGAGGAGTLASGTAGGTGDTGSAGAAPTGGTVGVAATGPQNTGGGGGGAYSSFGGGTTSNGYAGGSGYPLMLYNSGTMAGGAGGVAPANSGQKGVQSYSPTIGNTGTGGSAGCTTTNGSPAGAQNAAGGGGGGGGKTIANKGGNGGTGWFFAITYG